MNFLLHRHLALAHLGDPAAGVGAMLPDLWRMVDRGLRPRPGVAATAADPPSVRGLLAGVEHHLAGDAWFHHTEVFTAGLAATTARLRREPFTARKVVLMAHVAWELCLDGALLRRHDLDPFLAALRRDLAALAAPDLATAAARHGRRPDEPAPDLDNLLADLAHGQWIAGYRHGHGLTARLGGVRRRVGLEPLGEPDRERLAAALDDRLHAADAALPALLAAAEAIRPR